MNSSDRLRSSASLTAPSASGTWRLRNLCLGEAGAAPIHDQRDEEQPEPGDGAGQRQGEGAHQHLAGELAAEQRSEACDHRRPSTGDVGQPTCGVSSGEPGRLRTMLRLALAASGGLLLSAAPALAFTTPFTFHCTGNACRAVASATRATAARC